MSAFKITISATSTYLTSAPTLEVLFGASATVIAFKSLTSSGSTHEFSFTSTDFDFATDIPDSLKLRFKDDGNGAEDGDRDIVINSILINGQSADSYFTGGLSSVLDIRAARQTTIDANSGDLNDFVYFTLNGSDTDMYVDLTGTAGGGDHSDAVKIATLQGITTGLHDATFDDLISAGTLVTGGLI